MWQLLLLCYRLIPTATQEVSTVIIPFHICRHWSLEMYGACQLVRGKVQPWPQSASRTHLPNFLVVQIFTFLSLVLPWKVFFQNVVHFHCIPRLCNFHILRWKAELCHGLWHGKGLCCIWPSPGSVHPATTVLTAREFLINWTSSFFSCSFFFLC